MRNRTKTDEDTQRQLTRAILLVFGFHTVIHVLWIWVMLVSPRSIILERPGVFGLGTSSTLLLCSVAYAVWALCHIPLVFGTRRRLRHTLTVLVLLATVCGHVMYSLTFRKAMHLIRDQTVAYIRELEAEIPATDGSYRELLMDDLRYQKQILEDAGL